MQILDLTTIFYFYFLNKLILKISEDERQKWENDFIFYNVFTIF